MIGKYAGIPAHEVENLPHYWIRRYQAAMEVDAKAKKAWANGEMPSF